MSFKLFAFLVNINIISSNAFHPHSLLACGLSIDCGTVSSISKPLSKLFGYCSHCLQFQVHLTIIIITSSTNLQKSERQLHKKHCNATVIVQMKPVHLPFLLEITVPMNLLFTSAQLLTVICSVQQVILHNVQACLISGRFGLLIIQPCRFYIMCDIRWT